MTAAPFSLTHSRENHRVLLFKKKFLDAIRRGTKTQTVRLWKYRRYRAGQRSYIPGVGYITIDAIDPVAIDALTEEDAKLDGFEDTAALRRELEAIYAEKESADYQAFRVRFTVLPEEEQRRIRREKAAEKASKKNGRSRRPSRNRSGR
jgi:hypothetical protein